MLVDFEIVTKGLKICLKPPYLGSKVVVLFPDMSNVRSVAVTGVMEVLRGSSVYITEVFRGIQLGPGLVRSWKERKKIWIYSEFDL